MTATTHNSDSRWSALVADYRAKRDVWAKSEPTADEYAAYNTALASLPWPDLPPFGPDLPPEMQDMTVGEVIALASQDNAPAEAKAWATWWSGKDERDKARADLRLRYLGAADARLDAANKSYFAALDALAAYRVSTLHDLVAKIEIIDADYDEGDIPHERLTQILADVRRFAGEKLKAIEMAEREPIPFPEPEKPGR
jgi:hypothetical protein